MPGLNEYTLVSETHTGSNGLLTKPSSATTLIGPNKTTTVSSAQTIGFDFALAQKNYTQFIVSPSGWLMLDGNSPGMWEDFSVSTVPWSSTSNGRVLLFPWWDDLRTFGGVHTWLDSVVVGSIAYRVRVVQWDVLTDATQTATAEGFCGTTDNYENIKFQAILFANSSRVEYRYGDQTVVGSPPSTAWGASCGIRLVGSSEDDGDYRDFFGATGTPAGSTSPYLANLLTRAGGAELSSAYQYPGNAGNSTGVSYNFVLTLTGTSNVAYLIPRDDFLATRMFKVKIISDHNHVSLGHCADTEDREKHRVAKRCP